MCFKSNWQQYTAIIMFACCLTKWYTIIFDDAVRLKLAWCCSRLVCFAGIKHYNSLDITNIELEIETLGILLFGGDLLWSALLWTQELVLDYGINEIAGVEHKFCPENFIILICVNFDQLWNRLFPLVRRKFSPHDITCVGFGLAVKR